MPTPSIAKRRPGLLMSAFSSHDDEMRTTHLPPWLFAPCKWKTKQRFNATGYLRVFTAGQVAGSELDDNTGKPRLFDVRPGDYIVRGEDDMFGVLTPGQFKIMALRLKVRMEGEGE